MLKVQSRSTSLDTHNLPLLYISSDFQGIEKRAFNVTIFAAARNNICALRNAIKLRPGGGSRGEIGWRRTRGARVDRVVEALFGHDLDIGCSCLTRNPAQLGESERGRTHRRQLLPALRLHYATPRGEVHSETR